jgi:hypothetical protein
MGLHFVKFRLIATFGTQKSDAQLFALKPKGSLLAFLYFLAAFPARH